MEEIHVELPDENFMWDMYDYLNLPEEEDIDEDDY